MNKSASSIIQEHLQKHARISVSENLISLLRVESVCVHFNWDSRKIIEEIKWRLICYFVSIGRLSFIDSDYVCFKKAIYKTKQGWISVYNATNFHGKVEIYDVQFIYSLISGFEEEIESHNIQHKYLFNSIVSENK